MTMASQNLFDTNGVLTYLGLPLDYDPSPSTAPVPFLTKHLRQLPPDILHWFNSITTPQQRTAVLLIRNRRFNFTQSNPPEFRFPAAVRQWPALWEEPKHIGQEEAKEEKEWAETTFLGGEHQTYVKVPTTIMIALILGQEHRSPYKLCKSCSYAELENDSFMDILRYSLNASPVTRCVVDLQYISSRIFMKPSIGMTHGMEKTEK